MSPNSIIPSGQSSPPSLKTLANQLTQPNSASPDAQYWAVVAQALRQADNNFNQIRSALSSYSPSSSSTILPAIVGATHNAAPIRRPPTSTQASQLLTDFFGDHLSVYMFGAKGDGVTDDTSAIQSAINAVAATTTVGEVLVPVAKYLVGQINMVSGIRLRCAANTTFLANSANLTMFKLGNSVVRSGIFGGGCVILSNGHPGLTAISISPDDTHAGNSNHFSNITIGKDGDQTQSCAIGVYAQNVFFCSFTDIRIPLPTVGAFWFSVNSNSITCVNCSTIAVTGAPFAFQINNNGNFTSIGCTIEGTMVSLVYQTDCCTFLNCYFEDSGATSSGAWVQVGTPTGTQTSCISFIGCVFNEGTLYALDVYQVFGLVVRGCSLGAGSSAAFRVWNDAYNSAKSGWDVGGNFWNGITPFAFPNATSQDESSNISQDTVAPLKFTGTYAFGSPFVPPDASMAAGEGTLYMNPQNGFMQYKFQDASLNDVTSGGAFTGTGNHTYTIQVTAAGTPDTVQWQEDGGTWTTGLALTGSAQTMSNGVAFTAAATTGHTVGTTWNIQVFEAPVTSSQDINPAALQSGNGGGLPVGQNFGTVVSGYTGSWASANGTRTATVVAAFFFTIPVNATGFGVATGSPTFTFIGPAIKEGIIGPPVGADRIYYDPTTQSATESIYPDGLGGGIFKGYGGVRLSRAQGGGSEAAQTLLMAGGFAGIAYFSNLLIGLGFAAPLTTATLQISDLVNNFTYVDIIAGSSQGANPLLRALNAALTVLFSVSPAGDLLAAGGFGCNGKATQTAATSGGPVATTAPTQATPYGFTTTAQFNGVVTLLNNIQAALVANGIMS